MPAWQATCGERLPEVIPPETTRPVRGFSQDERRVGRLTIRRRRRTASGVQPVGLIQHPFEGLYIYGAVAPTTGERLFLEWPSLNAATFQLVIDVFAQASPDSWNILLLDNRGAQTAPRLRWPAHVQPVWLPPYCPELNPSERVWRDVKDDLAWEQCTNLDAQQAYVATLWQAYDAPTLQALTGYAYVVEAIHALCS
jgi:DDE superfamily endonuclease